MTRHLLALALSLLLLISQQAGWRHGLGHALADGHPPAGAGPHGAPPAVAHPGADHLPHGVPNRAAHSATHPAADHAAALADGDGDPQRAPADPHGPACLLCLALGVLAGLGLTTLACWRASRQAPPRPRAQANHRPAHRPAVAHGARAPPAWRPSAA